MVFDDKNIQWLGQGGVRPDPDDPEALQIQVSLTFDMQPGRKPFTLNKRLSKAGRSVYDWLPIFDWKTADVFDIIDACSQTPHPAYALGNERLSCVFCIFGSDNDLRNGARARPDLAAKYIALEDATGKTMFHKTSLRAWLGE